jgi:hypothetical protein
MCITAAWLVLVLRRGPTHEVAGGRHRPLPVELEDEATSSTKKQCCARGENARAVHLDLDLGVAGLRDG